MVTTQSICLVVVIALSISSCSRQRSGENRAPSQDEIATNLICMESVIDAARSYREPDADDNFVDFGLLPAMEPQLAEMHPIRAALSAEVKDWPSEFKRRSYEFVSDTAYWGNMFHSFAIEVMGPPPRFTTRDQAPSLRHLMPAAFDRRDELSRLFQLCYRQLGKKDQLGHLLQLWKQHQFAPKRINEIRSAVSDYLRLSGAEGVPKFVVVYDPLMPPGTGANADPPTGTVLLVGPWLRREKAEMILSHEFLHKPLLAIASSTQVANAIAESECAFRLVEKNYGYDNWQSYLLENLVRTISYRVPHPIDHASDFVFEPFLKAELLKYETDDESFEEFWVSALPRLREQFCSAAAAK